MPLKDFLTELGYHPLFWPFALFAPFLVLFLVVVRFQPRCRHVAHLRYVGAALALLLLGVFAAAAWANLRSAAFPDHVQPCVASLSARFWRGEPVYQDFVTPERYSLHYGPLLYAIIGPVQGLLGPTVFATKLPGTLAAVGTLLLTFLVIAKATDRLVALCFTGLAAAFLLHSFHLSFSARGDPFIILAVALGLWAATQERSRTAVVLGCCLGVAVNLKLHSAAYFLPILALARQQHWSASACRGGWITAAVTATLPFLVFPQVSWVNYLHLLKVASKHGFGPNEYRGTVEWLVGLAFPALFALGIMQIRMEDYTRRFLTAQRLTLAALGVAFLLLLVPASKVGAGKHHFLPFVPILMLLAARISYPSMQTFLFRSAGPAVAAALACSWLTGCTVAALHAANYVFQTTRHDHADAERCLADLLRIREQHPAAALLVAPAGDDTYQHTFGRFRLIAEGMPVGIDPCAFMDFVRGESAEFDITALTRTTAEQTGRPVLYVLPKHGDPFSQRTLYPPFGPLFSDQVRSDFHRIAARIRSTEFFDIYQPRGNAAP